MGMIYYTTGCQERGSQRISRAGKKSDYSAGRRACAPYGSEKNPTIQEGSYHQPLTIDN